MTDRVRFRRGLGEHLERLEVPDFDGSVGTATGKEVLSRMELYGRYGTLVLFEVGK